MAVLRCKMCGGDLSIERKTSIFECKYCGTTQTIPGVESDKKLRLFDRANRLRSTFEFDKASGVYESIVAEFPEEAEGYWGLLLCKYGIEYVDDPATAKKIPTCHRSSFDSIFDQPDFEMVMEYADDESRGLYREEAKRIEDIRKGIVEVSKKENPYDVFICYKETEENGERTIDSVIAQDVYDELTRRGYRVFFSRITLENKLGQEYEPFIFSALSSAVVMLVFGTSYDHFNAVWVKNEWARYLQIMLKDNDKHLIPCYRDIDAYDMPKEFTRFQSQDMGKVGAIQDLIRGIDKLTGKGAKSLKDDDNEQTVVGNQKSMVYVKRGYFALEDSDWKKAAVFFEQALNEDAECAEAYFGKLLAIMKNKTMTEYFDMLRNKYEATLLERCKACNIEKEHIEEEVRQHADDFVSGDFIRALYVFDLGFDSYLNGWKNSKQMAMNEIESAGLLIRARRFATGKFKSELSERITELIQYFDDKIKSAQKYDDDQAEMIRSSYLEHIADTDASLERFVGKYFEWKGNRKQQIIKHWALGFFMMIFLVLISSVGLISSGFGGILVFILVVSIVLNLLYGKDLARARFAKNLYETGDYLSALLAFHIINRTGEYNRWISMCEEKLR